jgi:hypothetical protein
MSFHYRGLCTGLVHTQVHLQLCYSYIGVMDDFILRVSKEHNHSSSMVTLGSIDQW